MTYDFDLGGHSHRISTESPEAQVWFDRGLNWLYGFNHDEAVECFKRARAFDPECAMTHWGLALAAGPNYNFAWKDWPRPMLAAMLPEARQNLARARACAGNATALEQALIAALDRRYQTAEPPGDQGELEQWSADYAEAMRDVYTRFGDDPEVAALFADAMLNCTPWKLWDMRTGEPGEGAHTLECQQVLERAIDAIHGAGANAHTGIWHYYIHLMEMSPCPERALQVSDELRRAAPDAGHLIHMATHIYMLCGDYESVVEWNRAASRADLKFWRYAGAMNSYSGYRAHNYHFQIYGAMFVGQLQPALLAADGLRHTLPDSVLRAMPVPMQEMLEPFLSMKTHALVRFGRWQELVDEPVPANTELYAVSTVMNYYGKAIAHANLKDFDAAKSALQSFEAAAAGVDPRRYMHTNRLVDIFNVAREMIHGEMKYHEGEFDDAFAHLRRAVELDDGLAYDEPRGWMMPTRHPLGALLLEQGNVQEAAEAYEADLGLNDVVARSGRHPGNVWALLGLHECYTRLGRETEAALIKPALDVALGRADAEVQSSCFCAMPLGEECCE
jgi:tetratricopeptide (TPR) repeat protein